MPKINTSINIEVSEEVYRAYKNSTVKQEFIKEALESKIYFDKKFNELKEMLNSLSFNEAIAITTDSLEKKGEDKKKDIETIEVKKEILDESTANTLNSFLNFSLGGDND